ncbi:MAG: hypothetical protein EXS31_02525 [Pedosphaera sp.]|nr:hypothetical protein [Pedosphaera sp.]
MKTSTGFDPENLIQIVQLILMQLGDTLSAANDLHEDVRATELKKKLQSYRDKIARLKSVVAKHRDVESRKRELTKDNDRRNPRGGKGGVGRAIG